MADAHGSGPCVREDVGVQVPPRPHPGLTHHRRSRWVWPMRENLKLRLVVTRWSQKLSTAAMSSWGQLRLPEDERGYTVCGIGLHGRRYVAVEVERDRDVGVTKPFLDDLRMYARLEGEGRPGMAQVVQTYRGQPEFGGAVPEVARRRIRMKRRPVLMREDEA